MPGTASFPHSISKRPFSVFAALPVSDKGREHAGQTSTRYVAARKDCPSKTARNAIKPLSASVGNRHSSTDNRKAGHENPAGTADAGRRPVPRPPALATWGLIRNGATR